MRLVFRDRTLKGRRLESWSREQGLLMTPHCPLVTAEARVGWSGFQGVKTQHFPFQVPLVAAWVC